MITFCKQPVVIFYSQQPAGSDFAACRVISLQPARSYLANSGSSLSACIDTFCKQPCYLQCLYFVACGVTFCSLQDNILQPTGSYSATCMVIFGKQPAGHIL